MVVEDDPLIRMDAVDLVEEAGFRALEAASADEALSILDEVTELFLLFTDIDMPGSMDGLALANVISVQRPGVKVVITSGQHLPDTNDMPHAAVFIPKPYGAARLVSLLQAEHS